MDKHWYPVRIERLGMNPLVRAKHWGNGNPRRTFGEEHWNEPLKWNESAKQAGVRLRVFCASMADIMDEQAPEGERERLWELIRRTLYLDWQLLTKRPENYKQWLPPDLLILKNVWVGISAEDQEHYDKRWPLVLALRPRPQVTFVSYEPALGPLRLNPGEIVPDWIIVGGESGPHRRPMQEKWARDLLQQCRDRGVAFFMKQMSARTPEQGKHLIPPDLMVQEFPSVQCLAVGRT